MCSRRCVGRRSPPVAVATLLIGRAGLAARSAVTRYRAICPAGRQASTLTIGGPQLARLTSPRTRGQRCAAGPGRASEAPRCGRARSRARTRREAAGAAPGSKLSGSSSNGTVDSDHPCAHRCEEFVDLASCRTAAAAHLGICDCRDQNAVASNEVRSEHLNRSLVMGVRRVEERDDDVRVERALTCFARSRYLEPRLAAGHPVRVMLARAWTPSLRRRDRRAIVRTAVDVRTALREPHDYWFLSDREAPERCPRLHRRLIRPSISA
jgi:hypothetical protein